MISLHISQKKDALVLSDPARGDQFFIARNSYGDSRRSIDTGGYNLAPGSVTAQTGVPKTGPVFISPSENGIQTPNGNIFDQTALVVSVPPSSGFSIGDIVEITAANGSKSPALVASFNANDKSKSYVVSSAISGALGLRIDDNITVLKKGNLPLQENLNEPLSDLNDLLIAFIGVDPFERSSAASRPTTPPISEAPPRQTYSPAPAPSETAYNPHIERAAPAGGGDLDRPAQRGVIHPDMITMIKRFESQDPENPPLEAYRDGRGIPTIGHGHTLNVQMGDKITREEAEILFQEDLVIHIADMEAESGSYLNVINQRQYNALVCLFFNTGTLKRADGTVSNLMKGLAASTSFAESAEAMRNMLGFLGEGDVGGLTARRENELAYAFGLITANQVGYQRIPEVAGE
jgi:lysozyme